MLLPIVISMNTVVRSGACLASLGSNTLGFLLLDDQCDAFRGNIEDLINFVVLLIEGQRTNVTPRFLFAI